jgi:hypothetical protein
MKTNVMLFFIIGILNAQIKITNSGRISLLSIQNPIHDVHAFGYDFGLTYANTTLLFRPRADSYAGSYIGSTDQIIKFYQGNWNILYAGYLTYASDERLKNSISNVNNCLSIVKNLQPKKFRYNNFINNKFHYGFLAQDLYNIIPEIVDTIKNDELGINYHEIIPLLVGAIKDLNNRIDSIFQTNANSRTFNNHFFYEKKIDSLIRVIHQLRQNIDNITQNCCNSSLNNQIPMTENLIKNMPGADEIELRNIPNPFHNITSIVYSVPSLYKNDLYLVVLTLNGKMIRKIKMNSEQGKYELNLSDIQSGAYIYGLMHKNELIKTKILLLDE